MDPPTSASAVPAARDEELRGECAKAFEHYKKGNLTRGTDLLKKLLARHPAHPLLHYAYGRLAHMRALEQRQPAGITKHSDECRLRLIAGPGSLLAYLLCAQAFYDYPTLNDQVLDLVLDTVRDAAVNVAASPLNSVDLEHAKAIATFDEEVLGLALFPDVRECADSAAYRSQALANLTKAPAKIKDLHREFKSLVRSNPEQSALHLFINLRDAEHSAVAARAGARGRGGS